MPSLPHLCTKLFVVDWQLNDDGDDDNNTVYFFVEELRCL